MREERLRALMEMFAIIVKHDRVMLPEEMNFASASLTRQATHQNACWFKHLLLKNALYLLCNNHHTYWIDEIVRMVYEKTKCLSTGTGSYKTMRLITRFSQYSVLIKQDSKT